MVWRFLLTSNFKTFVHLRHGNELAFIVLYINLRLSCLSFAIQTSSVLNLTLALLVVWATAVMLTSCKVWRSWLK